VGGARWCVDVWDVVWLAKSSGNLVVTRNISLLSSNISSHIITIFGTSKDNEKTTSRK
jgi:hypothetical protein